MRKKVTILLCTAAVCMLSACAPKEAATPTQQSETAKAEVKPTEQAKELTGQAQGFAGVVTAKVTMEGDKITGLVVTGDKETKDIGTNALEQLPAAILEKGSVEVDAVAGATVTSDAIIMAVQNAIDPVAYPYVEKKAEESKAQASSVAAEVYQGLGIVSFGRLGPGKDDKETPVYSVNQVFANILFDGDGKILNILVDQLEMATPNYDGESMPHFTGFPGQSYNYDENHDEKVDSQLEQTEDEFLAQISGWESKRDRGEGYVMGTGSWQSQMNKFQEVFVGMTVEEIKEWFAKYCSDLNGRPLKAGSDKPEDTAKYDALAQDEKDMLADIVSSATMSLNDSHGNIIAAIEEAYENRVPLEITEAAALGFGLSNSGRVGPGKDDKDVPVYSLNQVAASTLFDSDGKIAAIYIDQIEAATPNYDGEGMPHFAGFPGQSYNSDDNHDGTVDSVYEETEDGFMANIEGWKTKRERGDSYVMGTGTWEQQMDAFQKLFVGKTVEEVEEWFAKYCSDLNGRPLKAGSDKPEDAAKYDALNQDEKDMLADAVSSATMSLNDSHGNIIEAIRKSFEKKVAINLTVK